MSGLSRKTEYGQLLVKYFDKLIASGDNVRMMKSYKLNLFGKYKITKAVDSDKVINYIFTRVQDSKTIMIPQPALESLIYNAIEGIPDINELREMFSPSAVMPVASASANIPEKPYHPFFRADPLNTGTAVPSAPPANIPEKSLPSYFTPNSSLMSVPAVPSAPPANISNGRKRSKAFGDNYNFSMNEEDPTDIQIGGGAHRRRRRTHRRKSRKTGHKGKRRTLRR